MLRKVTKAMNLGSLTYAAYADWMGFTAYLMVGSGKDRNSIESDAIARLCQSNREGAGSSTAISETVS